MSTEDIIFSGLCVLFVLAAVYGLLKTKQASKEQRQQDQKDKEQN